MKACALLILGVIACGGAPPAQRAGAPRTGATPAPVKHPEMLSLLERYLRSPMSVEDGDLKKISDFVVQSSDVTVEIDPIAVPFIQEDIDEGVKNVVLIGFLAGNAAAQLRTGVKRDDPVAGVEGELAVYLILKAHSTTTLKDRKVVSPSLDALLEVRARGELASYLETTRARRGAGDDAAGSSAAPAGPASAPAGPASAPTDPASAPPVKDPDSE
jgi:hypothetical protein